MQELSVLQNARASDVQSEPYPHIVVPDALPAALYDELAAAFPPPEDLGVDSSVSNVRWDHSAHQVLANPSLPSIWREFIAFHTSQAFYDEIAEIFGEAVRKLYPDRFPTQESVLGMRAGIRKVSKSRHADILMDAQISGNTAVTVPSSVRATHVDQGNKLFSGLFYMRPEGYDAVGGDLTISKFAPHLAGKPERFSRIRGVYVDEQDVVHVRTVAYDRNQLVLFINSLDSLHGVTIRQPTDLSRLFVNLVGVVKPPLYHTDGDGGTYAKSAALRGSRNPLKKLVRRWLRA